MNKKRTILFDLETFGTLPYSVICQGSIIEIETDVFNIKKFLGPINVNTDSCTEAGMKIDNGTVIWWLSQSKEAQEGILKEPRYNIRVLLESFLKFIAYEDCTATNINNYPIPSKDELDNTNFKLWSHSSFDIPMINSALRVFKLPEIPFWKCLDMRTIMELTNTTKSEVGFQGVEHDSMSDVYHEAQLLYLCLNKYNSINKASKDFKGN